MIKAFTLVELLIVIAIIAILAAIAIPQYTKYVNKAAAANAQATISSCVNMALAAYADNGSNSTNCTLPNGIFEDSSKKILDKVEVILDNNGTLSKVNFYNGTTKSSDFFDNNTTAKYILVKGHKVYCKVYNGNVVKCSNNNNDL